MRARRIAIGLMMGALCAPASAGGFDPWTQTARYELEYRIDLATVLAAGSDAIRVWIPTPAESSHQRVLSRKIESPWPVRHTQDDLGNHFIYLEPNRAAASGSEIVMRFVVQRSPSDGLIKSAVQPETPQDPRRYVGAQSRIPLDGQIREIAQRESRGLDSDAEKIRAFYDYVNRTMRYGQEGRGWGRGDAIWACTAQYGNCTDFHSLFIGLARSQGIPARFVIGFPVPADKEQGTIPGYHCWAEAYDADWGWRPLDASDAWKSKRFDDYFGKLPSDRVTFTIGRDLTLEPPQQGEPLNFFIYPYVEDGGRPIEDVPHRISFRRLSAAVTPPHKKGSSGNSGLKISASP